MTHKIERKAVIYCRVSSAAQTKRGDGLASQQTRCQEYARMTGACLRKAHPRVGRAQDRRY